MLYAFAAPEATVQNRALSRILARHLRVEHLRPYVPKSS